MSGFASRKFYKYRALRDAPAFEDDTPCTTCGYNLRGLQPGRACPECGATIELINRAAELLLREGSLRFGFLLGALTLAGVLALQFGSVIVGIFGGRGYPVEFYAVTFACLSVTWLIASWCMTTSGLDRVWSWSQPARRAIRVTQLGWPVWAGIFVGLAFSTATSRFASAVMWLSIMSGMVGSLGLAFVMAMYAQEIEQETAARRLTNAMWFLVPATLLVYVLSGTIAWFTIVLLLMALVFWATALTMYALGLFKLFSASHWAAKGTTQRIGRDQRIAEQRAELEAEVAAQVRPARHSAGAWDADEQSDIPLDR